MSVDHSLDRFTGNTLKDKQVSNLHSLKPIIISTYELNDISTSPQSSTKQTFRVPTQTLPLQTTTLQPQPPQDYEDILHVLTSFLLSQCALQLDRNMHIESLSNYFLTFLTLWSVWHDLFSVQLNLKDYPLFKILHTIIIVSIYYGLGQAITALFYSVGSTLISFFSLVLLSKIVTASIFLTQNVYKRQIKQRDIIRGIVVIVTIGLYVPLLIIPVNMIRYYWIMPLVLDYGSKWYNSHLMARKRYTQQITFMLVFPILSAIAQFTLLTFITGVLSMIVVYLLSISHSQYSHSQPSPLRASLPLQTSSSLQASSLQAELPSFKVSTLLLHPSSSLPTPSPSSQPITSHVYILIVMMQSASALLFGSSLNYLVQQVNDYYAAYSVYNVIVPNSYTPSVYITMNSISEMIIGNGGEYEYGILQEYPQALQGKTVVSGGSSYLVTWDPNLNLRVAVGSFCVFLVCTVVFLFIGRGDRLWIKAGILRMCLSVIVIGIGSMNGQVGITMFIECGVVILGLLIEHSFVRRQNWLFLDRLVERTLS